MINKDRKAFGLSRIKAIISLFTLSPFGLVVLYRLSNWLYRKNVKLLPGIIHAVEVVLFSADISPMASIGEGFSIAHSVGIVIGYDTVIGKNAHIFQNVTIGSNNSNKNGRVMPIIGDNVNIYTGAVVIGAIEIGDNVMIGANSVVNKDCPSNVVVVGIPAKIIKVTGVHTVQDMYQAI
jgi:serine O-acetyltransferase